VGEFLDLELTLSDGSDDVRGRVIGRPFRFLEDTGRDAHDGVGVGELPEDLGQLGADAVAVEVEGAGTGVESVRVFVRGCAT
jgi:hypothetical protein